MTAADNLLQFYQSTAAYFEKIRREKRKMNEGRIKILLKKIISKDVFLDVGCGPGLLANLVAEKTNARSFGLDISPHGIALAKKNKPKAKFVLGSANRLPFPSNSFSAIANFEVLEHLENPKICLKEMVRCCRPGGKIFISLPHWFIGIRKRKNWFLNVLTLPGFLIWLYLNSYFRAPKLCIKSLKTELDPEEWEKKTLSELADKDACSWIFSLSLINFLKAEGLKIDYFNSFQFLEDAIELKKESLKKKLLSITIFCLKNMPILRYFGSGCFIIVSKPK